MPNELSNRALRGSLLDPNNNGQAPIKPSSGLITHLICAWLTYWTLAFALPIETDWTSGGLDAVLLQFTFVLTVVAGLSLPSRPIQSRTLRTLPSREIHHWITWALFLGLAGLGLQVFDKVVVQQIDYTQGIAAARLQWGELGEERSAQVSSAASALAYLIGNGYFIVVLLLLHESCELRRTRKAAIWILVILIMIGNLALTGGRSGLLFFFGFVLAMCARRGNCLHALRKLPLGWKLLGILVGIACTTYALYVFYARAELQGMSPHEYTLNFLPYLGMTPSPALSDLDPASFYSSVLSLLTLAISYLTHSLQTTLAILEAPVEGKGMLFSHIQSLVARTGMVGVPDTDWFLSGRFPSLPGALYHQTGLIGVVVGGGILGLSARFVAAWHSERPRNLLPLVSYGLIHAVLVLSPLLLAADFLNFPFILTSAAAVSALTMLSRR